MIAQFICDQTGRDSIDDGTVAALEANFIAALQAVGRIKLAASLNLYVATTGSDTNNTGQNAGSPFQTIQKAVNVAVSSYDTQLHNITVNIANGTYPNPVVVSNPLFGGSTLSLVGNPASPTSVLITANNAHAIHCGGGGNLSISGLSLQTTGSVSGIPSIGILSDGNSNVTITGAMNFGLCAGNHMWASSGGNISITSPYSITGGAQAHYFSGSAGVITIPAAGVTVTLSGSPAFSVAFAEAIQGGNISISSAQATFSGSATGKRYLANLLGQINTGGSGVNYFPGNVAGTADASTFSLYS